MKLKKKKLLNGWATLKNLKTLLGQVVKFLTLEARLKKM
jgi:hypothetical protein